MRPRPRTARLRSKPIRPFSRAALAALVLACAGAWPALAQEGGFAWSQFQGGPGRPGTAADAPAPPYRQRWRFTPPVGALSGAAIADEVAVAVGEQAVYALDLADGVVAWEIPRDGGPLSYPALGASGERRILVYLDGPPGEDDASATTTPSASPADGATDATVSASEIVAVDLSDRSELWRTPLEHRSRSGVTIDGERAYVGDDEGTVYAVDLGDGGVAWTAKAGGVVESPPVASGGTVYVVAQPEADPRVEILALDGATGEPAWPRLSASGFLAAAAAAGDGSLLVAIDRTVRAFGAEEGGARWEARVHGYFWPASAPLSADGAVYVTDEPGGVYRMDAADGARGWEHQTNERIVRGSPVLVGPYVVVGLGSGELVAIETSTGDLVSTTPSGDGYIGAIALSGEVLVAAKGGGGPGLVAFEHDPDGSLERRVSPTVLDVGALVGRFALAFLLVGVVILVPFHLLRTRMSPAFTREDDGADAGPDEEPS